MAVTDFGGHTVRARIWDTHLCTRSSEGDVRCWGENGSGQLGSGSLVRQRLPSPVVDIADVTDVSAGGRHTCAAATGSRVECWGANDWKQLGNGLRQAQTRPRRVGGLAGAATAVAAGDNHTCALIEAGAVECWGAND